MNIQAVTPNYVQNYSRNNNQPSKQVGFTGVRGDEVVRKIVSGADVRPDELVKEMKGTFGIKKDVAEDIMESLIGKIKGLFDSNLALQKKGIEGDNTIRTLLNESSDAKNQVSFLEGKIKAQDATIASKNEALAAKDKELTALKADFKKYEPAMKIKSLDEIGAVTLEDAFKVMDDMVAHKNAAMESMHEFLMTGKGQEEALAQIERHNILLNAEQDGLGKGKDFIAKKEEIANNGISTNGYSSLWFAKEMVSEAIASSPKSANYNSKAIAEQVKDNAMAILTPLTKDKGISSDQIAKNIEEVIQDSKDNQFYLKKGIEYLKKQNSDSDLDFVMKEVPYDFRSSTAQFKQNGVEVGWQWNFYELINLGKRL
ncbi:hypothetical protein J6E39_07660 [bacterium]|nr:hypothetical protein [bacterium]